MTENDLYKTLSKPSEEILYKEKNSKFFGYAFPIDSEETAKMFIETLKKQHHAARHWCYAYQIGIEEPNLIFRANDDGEPNNSAGMPIYGQIQSFEVTNVLVVVVRYFGGVKLGVGGLISAYKRAAQMALEVSEIVEKTVDVEILIKFDYKNMNKVMRIIKERNLNIISQKLELDCELTIVVRKSEAENTLLLFENLFEISAKLI